MNVIKKIIISVFGVMLLCTALVPQTVYAQNNDSKCGTLGKIFETAGGKDAISIFPSDLCSAADFLLRILNILFAFAGGVATLVIVIGGFMYFAAAGNAEQATKGRQVVTNAVIGLAIIMLAATIVNITANLVLGSGGSGGGVLNNNGGGGGGGGGTTPVKATCSGSIEVINPNSGKCESTNASGDLVQTDPKCPTGYRYPGSGTDCVSANGGGGGGGNPINPSTTLRLKEGVYSPERGGVNRDLTRYVDPNSEIAAGMKATAKEVQEGRYVITVVIQTKPLKFCVKPQWQNGGVYTEEPIPCTGRNDQEFRQSKPVEIGILTTLHGDGTWFPGSEFQVERDPVSRLEVYTVTGEIPVRKEDLTSTNIAKLNKEFEIFQGSAESDLSRYFVVDASLAYLFGGKKYYWSVGESPILIPLEAVGNRVDAPTRR
ncbi:MAG TPA: pilin [Patescibacteria group bacterium]|nr:pilin [Patescibacteria group bacterium]